MSNKSSNDKVGNYSFLRQTGVFKPLATLVNKCLLRAVSKYTFFFTGVIWLNLACNLDTGTEVILVQKDRYEFLQNYEDRTDAYMRRHLVDYFQSIALGNINQKYWLNSNFCPFLLYIYA